MRVRGSSTDRCFRFSREYLQRAGRGRGQRRLDGISLAIEFAAARVVAGLLYFVGLGGASLLVPGTVNAAVQYAQLGSNLWGVAFLVGSVSLIAVTTIDSLPVLLAFIVPFGGAYAVFKYMRAQEVLPAGTVAVA